MRDVGSSLIRRWYLTLVGVLATVGLAALALQVVHPMWESKSSIVLLPPRSTVLPGGNPYLQLGGLQPTLDLLVATLGDQQTTEAVKRVIPTADYTVIADTTSSGPVMIVTAHDRTPAGSLAARDLVVRNAPAALATLQDNLTIPTKARISTMVLTQDDKPLVVSKNQIRAVVVAAGAGLVATAFSVALVDGYLVRRRLGVARSRGRRAASPPQPVAGPVAAPLPAPLAPEAPDAEPAALPAALVGVPSEWDAAGAAPNGQRASPVRRRRGSSTNDGQFDSWQWDDRETPEPTVSTTELSRS